MARLPAKGFPLTPSVSPPFPLRFPPVRDYLSSFNDTRRYQRRKSTVRSDDYGEDIKASSICSNIRYSTITRDPGLSRVRFVAETTRAVRISLLVVKFPI